MLSMQKSITILYTSNKQLGDTYFLKDTFYREKIPKNKSNKRSASPILINCKTVLKDLQGDLNK